jgi:hypothetical protein
MKNNTPSSGFLRGCTCGALLAVLGMSVSCMTTYDSQGNALQTVDPAVAIAGAAAAGLVGYAITNDNGGHHNHHYHGGGGYYRGGYARGGYAYNPHYRRY